MTRLRLLSLAALLTGFTATAVVADDKDDAKKIDIEKFVGSYKLVGGSKGGDKISDDAKKSTLTVTKDKMSLKSDAGEFVFGYKLDESKTPVVVDLTLLEPEGLKGAKAKGLIKVEPRKFTLIYHPKGETTPKEFKSTAENGYFLFDFEKAGKKGGKKKDKDGGDQ